MKIKGGVGLFFDEMISEVKNNGQSAEQRAIDLTCLKIATIRFLDSGLKDDAFDVFFCFTELFEVFGKGYDGADKLLNLLADHEMNTGLLLMKQRDHYSHSVYVFSLGLALFCKNEKIRNSYKNEFYGGVKYGRLEEFLYRWGMASLFHDVGYPFEVAADSIKEYDAGILGENRYPSVGYGNLQKFINFDEKERAWLRSLLDPRMHKYISDAHKFLLFNVKKIIKMPDDAINKMLENVFVSTEHTDHGYYSAILILRLFFRNTHGDERDVAVIAEAATAALMHNAFYKYNDKIDKNRKLSAEDSVIVFLLMLCDDLQIFDRQGYGRNSRSEPLPRDCFIDVKDRSLSIVYAYPDSAIDYKVPESDDKDLAVKKSAESTKKQNPKSDEKNYIVSEKEKLKTIIEKHYDLESIGGLSVDVEVNNIRTKGVTHGSASYFKNIFDIAKKIHESYHNGEYYNKMKEEWEELTLEYKMSNILSAKSYANKLNKVSCFYDDRELMLDSATELAAKEIDDLARDEHDRWVMEKKDMGWEYAEYDAGDEDKRNEMRSKRKHNCLVNYEMLSRNDQEKDIKTIKDMITNINNAGFKVYRISERKKMPDERRIGIVGFGDCSNIPADKAAKEIHDHSASGVQLLMICRCLDLDLKIAEEALELGMKIKIIMMEGDKILSDATCKIFERIKDAEGVKVLTLPALDEKPANTLYRYIAANSDTIFTIGKEPGLMEEDPTFMIKQKAKEYGQNVVSLFK